MIIIFEKRVQEILANNIVYFRLEKRWSQEQFAEALGTGTTSNYISELENAKRNPRMKYIGRLADILEIPMYELFVERPKIKNHRVSRR